jgi:thioredoxin-related protein
MNKAIKFIPVVLAAILLTTAAFKSGTDVPEELAIGSSIPKADLKMKDISGKDLSLNDVKTAKGLVVIFSCNTCPFIKLYMDRIKEASAQAGADKIGFILVNSNEALRDNEDSFEAMKKHADDNGYSKTAYVVDANSVLANAFGATRTPHAFVFDAAGKLVYRGAIDDNAKDVGSVKEWYLRDAIGFVAENKKMSSNSTKSIGCSIKRKE